MSEELKPCFDQRTLMALRTGLKFGVWLFAVHDKNKGEVCGIMKTPLKTFSEKVDKGEYDDNLRSGWIAEGEMQYEKEPEATP